MFHLKQCVAGGGLISVMTSETTILVVFAIAVVGGVAVVIAGMRHRARLLEMTHRERLAMIERGMVPPERGPTDFAHTVHDRSVASQKMFSVGVVTTAFGLGLGMLITFAGGAPGPGIGVGGAIALLGLAVLVNARFAAGPSPPKPDDPR